LRERTLIRFPLNFTIIYGQISTGSWLSWWFICLKFRAITRISLKSLSSWEISIKTLNFFSCWIFWIFSTNMMNLKLKLGWNKQIYLIFLFSLYNFNFIHKFSQFIFKIFFLWFFYEFSFIFLNFFRFSLFMNNEFDEHLAELWITLRMLRINLDFTEFFLISW
jgi:hypothetical protein